MTRSAEWWAGWQEAIDFACRAVCRGCADALPIEPDQPGWYHEVSGGSLSHCSAVHIHRAAERERQAALEARGWDTTGGGDDGR